MLHVNILLQELLLKTGFQDNRFIRYTSKQRKKFHEEACILAVKNKCENVI